MITQGWIKGDSLSVTGNYLLNGISFTGSQWTTLGNNIFYTGGKVGIGTTNMPGDYKLYVKDGILAEKVKSAVHASTDWADHGLHKNYPLPSLLGEVEPHILKYGCLIGVPSGEEVLINGVEMVKMDATLLLKIEELTLYAIAQQKEIEQLKREIKKLKKIKKVKYEHNK